MYLFTPRLYKIKNKKSLKETDIWPADVITDVTGKKMKYWVMTPDSNFVPFHGYESGYYQKINVK